MSGPTALVLTLLVTLASVFRRLDSNKANANFKCKLKVDFKFILYLDLVQGFLGRSHCGIPSRVPLRRHLDPFKSKNYNINGKIQMR